MIHRGKSVLGGAAAALWLAAVPTPGGAAPSAEPGANNPLEDKLETLEDGKRRTRWSIRPYKENYLLPYTYNPDPNQATLDDPDDEWEREEVKFQISFLLPLWRDIPLLDADLLFGYTQLSFWQAYNDEQSVPFRTSNYEPEALLHFDREFTLLGWTHRAAQVAFVHQSNGGDDDGVDRSWDRVYLRFMLDRGGFVLQVRPWLRVSDDDKNPGIDQFLGYGDVQAGYYFRTHLISVTARNNFNLSNNRGAVEVSWSFPLNKYLKGYIQYFNGYGESLLDYNHRDQRIGVGLMLTDWL